MSECRGGGVKRGRSVFLCVVFLKRGVLCMGRRGADMRSGQCMKALSMGSVSHCPVVPSCHFHFAPSSPESGQL